MKTDLKSKPTSEMKEKGGLYGLCGLYRVNEKVERERKKSTNVIQKKGMIYEGFSSTTLNNNMAYTIEPIKKTTIPKTGAMCPIRLKTALIHPTVTRRHAACDSKRDRKKVISTRTSVDSVGKTHQVHHSNEYRD